MTLKTFNSRTASAIRGRNHRASRPLNGVHDRSPSDLIRRTSDSTAACRSDQKRPSPQPDILPRLSAGDPEAARDLVDRYRAPIRSLARNFSRDSADIEDAMQEVFLALWRNAAKFDAAKSPEGAFVNLIARRRLIDLYRRKKRQVETVHYESQLEVVPDHRARNAEIRVEAQLTAPVLETLRAKQREALLLSVYMGMSHTEIARHVDRPLGTVKTHIRRGLKRVREALEGVESYAH